VDKEFPIRKNIRLKEYDYSTAGYYFITICTKSKRKILSTIDVGTRIARPSDIGLIVESSVLQISEKYENVSLEKYVIMPNHVHMILALQHLDNNGRAMRVPTISTIINQFKGYVTKQVGVSLWQARFIDHIIRNENDYLIHWQYIDNNPAKWIEDRYYIE